MSLQLPVELQPFPEKLTQGVLLTPDLRREIEARYNTHETLMRKLDVAQRERSFLYKQVDRYREALTKLACLGNGDQPGNSIGNMIARNALEPGDSVLEKW